jgi:hypothetical protein
MHSVRKAFLRHLLGTTVRNAISTRRSSASGTSDGSDRDALQLNDPMAIDLSYCLQHGRPLNLPLASRMVSTDRVTTHALHNWIFTEETRNEHFI